MKNVKINVAAYAKKHGITLNEALNEIQKWLFSYGCYWIASNTNKEPFYNDTHCLYVDKIQRMSFSASANEDDGFFEKQSEQEIVPNRCSYVSHYEITKPETIVHNGVKYIKKDFDAAISTLTPFVG